MAKDNFFISDSEKWNSNLAGDHILWTLIISKVMRTQLRIC